MWRTVTLGDILSLQNGYAFKSSEYEDDGYFVMRITNVQQGYISAHNPKYVTIEKGSKLQKFVLNEGDILISLTGDVGRVGVIKDEHLPAALNQRVARVTDVKRELVNIDFLFAYMNSDTFRLQVEDFAHGAAQANVSTKDILSINLSLPPLAEQQRIVSKLDAGFAEIDRAIELVNEQILNFDTLLLQLLSFLYFEDGSTIRLLLKDIADVKGGKRLPKGEKLTSENTGFPYIRVTDFNDYGSIDTDAVLFVTAKVQKQISRYTITSKNVYVSIAGTIGKTGIIPETLDNANLTENAAKLVLKEGIDTQYVYYFTKTHSFEQQAIAQTRTAAQPKLALERLSSVELPVPDVKSQRLVAKLARAATDYKSQLVTNRLNKIDLLNTLKSAILAQELQPPQSEGA